MSYQVAERMVPLGPQSPGTVVPESCWSSPYEQGYGPDPNGRWLNFSDCTGMAPGPLTRDAAIRPPAKCEPVVEVLVIEIDE